MRGVRGAARHAGSSKFVQSVRCCAGLTTSGGLVPALTLCRLWRVVAQSSRPKVAESPDVPHPARLPLEQRLPLSMLLRLAAAPTPLGLRFRWSRPWSGQRCTAPTPTAATGLERGPASDGTCSTRREDCIDISAQEDHDGRRAPALSAPEENASLWAASTAGSLAWARRRPASRSRRANNSSSAQFPRHTPLLSSVRLFSGQTKGMGQLEYDFQTEHTPD